MHLFVYFIVSIIGFLITFIVLIRIFFMMITVQGQSMQPALIEGDRLLVMRHYPVGRLCIGQIVVGQMPAQETLKTHNNMQSSILFVKRLIGLPGDEVAIPISKLNKYSKHHSSETYDNKIWHIPKGHCFVKGDFHISVDSVMWGPIRLNTIEGVVLLKWPYRNHNLESSD